MGVWSTVPLFHHSFHDRMEHGTRVDVEFTFSKTVFSLSVRRPEVAAQPQRVTGALEHFDVILVDKAGHALGSFMS